MHTTRGEIPEDDLRKEVIAEKIPCGLCKTTRFFASDGELVREDILVEVDVTLLFPQTQGNE